MKASFFPQRTYKPEYLTSKGNETKTQKSLKLTYKDLLLKGKELIAHLSSQTWALLPHLPPTHTVPI